MKTQREKFEEWFFANIDANTFVEDLCWQAWCAAIESVVVELPELCDGENPCKCYYESESIENALDKAGIKYDSN
jgi:hypothetical protein